MIARSVAILLRGLGTGWTLISESLNCYWHLHRSAELHVPVFKPMRSAVSPLLVAEACDSFEISTPLSKGLQTV